MLVFYMFMLTPAFYPLSVRSYVCESAVQIVTYILRLCLSCYEIIFRHYFIFARRF
jgi:hypothetical protein